MGTLQLVLLRDHLIHNLQGTVMVSELSQSLLLVSGDELAHPQMSSSSFKVPCGCCQRSCLSAFDLAEPTQRNPHVLVLMPRLQLPVTTLSWPTPSPGKERGAHRLTLLCLPPHLLGGAGSGTCLMCHMCCRGLSGCSAGGE